MIRRADAHDISPIAKLVNDSAEYGLMLHRSLSYLYEHARDFMVAEEDGQIVGACGLRIIWANLAELYSLVVASSHRRRGLGKALVTACIEEARRLRVRRLMALTYEKDFFAAVGFQVVDRQTLPLKVWSECLQCPRNHACDEIAMIRVLEDVPDVGAPQPDAPPPGSYEVPVVVSVRRANGNGK